MAAAAEQGQQSLATGRDAGRKTRRVPLGRKPVYAALDLGTNNCRLLIAHKEDGGFRVIDAFSRIVRLGEGLARTGELSREAMTRTIDALRICARKMRRRHVTHARVIATEACRRATNCDQFIERVRRETGLIIETISTDEEAQLAVVGCSPLLDPMVPFSLVFDIGGGSTELTWVGSGSDPDLIDVLSLPFGVVTISERFGPEGLPVHAYDDMVQEMTGLIRAFGERNQIREAAMSGRMQMLGTSGTVTTLAGVNMGLARYDRTAVDGCYLDFSEIEAVTRRLATMPASERAAEPCIGDERADLVVSGCAILEAFCRLWPVGRLRVADRGLREGILLKLMNGSDDE